MYDFMIAGNDCPKILRENLKRLNKLYPNSIVFLYDWGHLSKNLSAFRKTNKNVKIIPWPSANKSNYCFQKIVCIKDCFYNNHEKPLVFVDSDVIILDRVDEVFNNSDCDIAVSWRPEYNYKKDEFNVGAWLNSGVIFFNNINVSNTKLFLDEWCKRGEKWSDKSWFVDQVELIKLVALALPDLSKGADLLGLLQINEHKISIKTLHYTIYNFYPEMPFPYAEYNPGLAKIIHLKSRWRKIKFNILPSFLRKKWIDNIKESHNMFLSKINISFNVLIFNGYNFIGYIKGKFNRILLKYKEFKNGRQ
ncbi:hypothetical protein ACFL5V_09930 [Fibrobacterota bacterium]